MQTIIALNNFNSFLISNYYLLTIIPELISGCIYLVQTNNVAILNIAYKTTRTNIYNLMVFLSKHSILRMKTLVELVVYDLPGKLYRFILIYNLLTITQNLRLKVYIYTNEVLNVPSISTIYKSAYWPEREIWDTFGVFFKAHNDLRRIISDYGFQGYAFRKDFPIIGFTEVQYQETDKSIRYGLLEQSAEYRHFKWNTNWTFDAR